MTQGSEIISHRGEIDGAIGRLISVSYINSAIMVNMPLFYPSGSEVSVRLETSKSGFHVSDASFGYREAELVGGEVGFMRRARQHVEDLGLSISDAHEIWVDVTSAEQLTGAIATVANASYDVSHAVVRSLTEKELTTLTDSLYRRLEAIFDRKQINYQAKIRGATGSTFHVSACVTGGPRLLLFDAVAKHYTSVASCCTKFQDMSGIENPPNRFAVVRDKAAMGTWLALISQAATVIQDNAPDAAFKWAA